MLSQEKKQVEHCGLTSTSFPRIVIVIKCSLLACLKLDQAFQENVREGLIKRGWAAKHEYVNRSIPPPGAVLWSSSIESMLPCDFVRNMKAFLTAALLLSSSLIQTVNAGSRFSDRVMDRFRRPEKFASQTIKSRLTLEERQANYKFLTNDTKRESGVFSRDLHF